MWVFVENWRCITFRWKTILNCFTTNTPTPSCRGTAVTCPKHCQSWDYPPSPLKPNPNQSLPKNLLTCMNFCSIISYRFEYPYVHFAFHPESEIFYLESIIFVIANSAAAAADPLCGGSRNTLQVSIRVNLPLCCNHCSSRASLCFLRH